MPSESSGNLGKDVDMAATGTGRLWPLELSCDIVSAACSSSPAAVQISKSRELTQPLAMVWKN
jgi:hypothetical protein